MTKDKGNNTTTAGRKSFFADRNATAALTALVLVYIAFFSATSIMTYRGFGMSAYDIGIHDQALWKLSTSHGFFNTIRGMNIWGDHCWIIMAAIAPFYSIVPKLETLLVVQTAALASGAFPLAAYAYRKIGSRPVAVMLAAAFLLSPALQNMNLENAHPEVLALPFLLWMIAAAETDSWLAYGVALLAALFCKEDIALTTFALGFYLFLRRNKKAGVITMVLSVVYFVVCMKLILPYWNGSGFFRFQSGYWFSEFWAHKFDANYYSKIMFRPVVGMYVWKLSFPLLGLFLLEPLLILAAIPGFMINVLSGNDYLIGIDYHYNYHTLPILFAAAAGGIATIGARLCLKRSRVTLLAAVILLSSIAANVAWSQAPISAWGTRLVRQWRNLQDSQDWERFKVLTASLPKTPDIPIAVSHNLVPALTHRNEIYMFPNPWKIYYWGIAGENQRTPDRIEWLVLDSKSIDKELLPLVNHLLDSREFCKVAEDGAWFVAKRNSPSGAQQGTIPPCAPLRTDAVLHAAPPERGMRGSVFIEKRPLTSLRSLSVRTPDFEIMTDTLAIPETQGTVMLSDGQSLRAKDNVRIVFTGKWHARGGKNTIFRIQADDGCRLYLDGKAVIDYDGAHAFGDEIVSEPLYISKGMHTIIVDYFEWGGNAGLSVEWKPAGGEFKPLQRGVILP